MTDPLIAGLSNPLTGSFDAVLQVSRPTVDRLLATMHQNHGNDAGLPTSPHRLVARIGDVPPQPAPSSGMPILMINAPRGTARAQIGAPSASFVADAPRDVDLSTWIRVRYRGDPGAVPLPEFIHGRIVARVGVEPESVGGVSGLRVTVSPDDAHIQFVDSGLTGDDLKNVTSIVRSFLRSRVDTFLELPADLPPAVADLQTLHDTQGREALSLPLTLHGAPPSPGNLALVFLEGSDFAIAVSGGYIISLIQSHLDALKATHPTFWIKVTGLGTANYTVTFTAADANWLSDGGIHVHVAGKAKTPTVWAPNASFTVTQDLKLKVHFPAGAGPDVSIVPIGEPDVSASMQFDFLDIAKNWAKNTAKARFAQARDAALAQAQPAIAQSMAKTQLLRDVLVRIDDAATLTWEKAAPSAAGLTLRGRIVLSPRKAPRVEFAEIGDGSGYSAFESWVPGGRIVSFYWTWWRSGDLAPLSNEPESYAASFADRYVLQEENLPTFPVSSSPGSGGQPTSGVVTPLPAGAFPASAAGNPVVASDGQSAGPVWGQACVAITGKYVDPKTGDMKGEWAQALMVPGLACSFAGFSPIPVVWEEFPIPPRIGGDPPPFQLHVNVLVVYAPADVEAMPEGAVLVEAIQQIERPDAGLVLLLASRLGTRGPSRELADRVQSMQRELPHVAVLLVDRDRPLPRGVAPPSADGRAGLRLVDPTGRIVWSHDGALDASALVAALRSHLVASPPPRPRLLRTTLRSGAPAPDFAFELEGHRVMLHRLRGRQVAVGFLPTDESPDVLLRRLSVPPGEPDEPRPLVVLVGDGERSGRIARRPRGFDLGTAADDGAIARLYGIQTRPTVVLVDWDGRVSTVQTIGPAMAPPRSAPGGGSAPS